MINLKKKILIVFLPLLFSLNVNAALQDSLFATIGNKAITRSDIVNEIKTILILNGENFTQENAVQLEAAAVKAAVQRIIKKIEIEKYGSLKFNQEDVNRELKLLAEGANVDLDTLKNIFVANGIDFSVIRNHIKIELQWNSLIFKLYKDRLIIDINEIEEQLKLIQNKKKVKEFLISELIIEPVASGKVNSEIEKIKNKIKTDGFKKVAMTLSISETSIRGGDLGWVNENLISEEFKTKIINTPIGGVSDAIMLPEGILFFQVRDSRDLEAFSSLEEAKNQLINAEKTKILNMHSLSHYDNLKRSITINYYQ